MDATLISIIIPVYNRPAPLLKTLESIAAQTFDSFEIIIVDDGSPEPLDATLAGHALQEKITLIRQENGGPSAARNAGMMAAKGGIIFYCDSDDVLYPHCLATVAALYENDDHATFSICNHRRTTILVGEDGDILATKDESRDDKPATLQDFYNWQVKTTSTGLSHRRFFRNTATWKSGFLIEDLEFLLQLAVLDPNGFRYIPEKLLDYNQVYGGDGMCSGASYADYAYAFGTIYTIHKNDPLMKDPSVYLDRVERYSALHEKAVDGKIPPPQYKYFERHWTSPDAA